MAVVSKLHDGALFANQLHQRPFNSLPTEAIADIFLHTLRAQNPGFPSINAAPLVFLLVCRRWNRIALSIPLLWTDVVLDEAPDGVRDIEREEKALMIWLHRSGRRPMSLKMMRTPLPLDSDVKDLESDLNPGVKDRRNELGYALGKVLPRCRDVVVQSNSSVIDVVLYHLRECAATGPLKQLALIFIRRPLSFGPDGLDNVYLDLSIFHRLHSIDVQTQPKGPYEADIKVTCAPPTRQFMRLSRLLQFSLERVSPDVAVEWLQSCPNVRTLAVAVDLPEPTEPVVRYRSGEIPMHEHLQDLWLAFNTDLKIYRDAGDGSTKAHQEFSPVHLPSIKRLTVELSLKGEGDPSETANFRKLHRTHGRVLTRIMHQLLQNSPQLTGLTLLGTRATTVEDMLALLEALPTLKEITIDGCFTDFAGVLMALSPHDCSGAAPRIRGLCPFWRGSLSIISLGWSWNRGPFLPWSVRDGRLGAFTDFRVIVAEKNDSRKPRT